MLNYFVSCLFRCSDLVDGLIISSPPGDWDVPADEERHVHSLWGEQWWHAGEASGAVGGAGQLHEAEPWTSGGQSGPGMSQTGSGPKSELKPVTNWLSAIVNLFWIRYLVILHYIRNKLIDLDPNFGVVIVICVVYYLYM